MRLQGLHCKGNRAIGAQHAAVWSTACCVTWPCAHLSCKHYGDVQQVTFLHSHNHDAAAGFRITACAATPDQAAFVLSVPRRRPMDETQETLRTSAFPSTHVKDKWAKNLYIAGVAYGRTVS